MLKRLQTNPFSTGSGRFRGYAVNQNQQSIDWFKARSQARLGDDTLAESLITLLDKSRLRLWLVIIFLGLVLLLGRLSYLQLMRGQYYKTVAEGNRVRVYTVKAPRGVLYDRNLQLLVKNIPSFSLAITPVDLPEDLAARRLVLEYAAQVSGQSVSDIEKLLSAQPQYSYQPVVVKESLNADEASLIKIQSVAYPGATLKVATSRQYLTTPETISLSHLLGYAGKISEAELQAYLDQGYDFDDYVGKTGLELSFETELKGKNGREHVEVDALGKTEKVLAFEKPVAGKNLVLTLDLELQRQAQSSLQRVLTTYGKKRGAVIALDPRNGEILALVNLPAFDNNLFTSRPNPEQLSQLFTDPNQPLFHRAISGEYPSGSTFKMIIAAAALEEGLITQSTGVNSVGGLAISSWFFPDWKAGGHGWTTVVKALAESVNTFFYIIGGGYQNTDGLGVERIKTYAERFGLNKKLGIDLPSEATGFLPSPAWKEAVKKEQWYIGDTYHLAIGQGDILVTPLQVAGWTTVFANGGTLYQPHLVRGTIETEVGPLATTSPKILNQDFISSETIGIVRQGLRQAVLTGSARGLGSLPVATAAKTGTAEWSSKNAPHAWITAFAPYDDPTIVVTVLVEEGGEGSQVALPVAADIIRWWSENR